MGLQMRTVAVMVVALMGATWIAPPVARAGGPPEPAGRKPKPPKAAGPKEGKDGEEGAQDGKNKKPLPHNLAVKAMKMVIEDADFEEMTFEEFADWLGRTTGATVVVRWKVLEKAGIEKDFPITLKRKKITLRELLALVFKQLTEDLRTVEVAAKADGNLLIISTKDELNLEMLTKSYDVLDLLVAIPKFQGSTLEDPTGERDKMPVRPRARGSETEITQEEQAQRLIAIIVKQVQPLSWKVNGGRGTIMYFKGRLVIYNNIEVHQQIGGILGEEEQDSGGSEGGTRKP